MTNFGPDAHLEGTNRLRWCQMNLGGRCEKRIGACNKSASIQRLYVVLQIHGVRIWDGTFEFANTADDLV